MKNIVTRKVRAFVNNVQQADRSILNWKNHLSPRIHAEFEAGMMRFTAGV